MANKKKSSSAKTKTSNSNAVKVSVGKTSKVVSMAGLRRWNMWLSVVFVLQAAAILILSKSITLPVVSHYLATDSLASQAAGHNVMALAVRHLFDIYVASLVAALLLVSAAAHGAMASMQRQSYEKGLSTSKNKLRWIDLGIGTSLLMIALGLINGIYDFASLLMIVVLVLLLNGLAYKTELYNRDHNKPISWRNFWGILLAGAAVWATVGSYLKSAIVYGNGLPHYIYWLDISAFILMLLIISNIWLTAKARGKWADYLYAERSYMILNLVLYTAIAWQIFFGLLH